MFTFSDYTLRAANDGDRELCQRWIDADPDHRGNSTVDFWTKREPGIDKFVLLDGIGEPVFFFAMERALRIHIQFGPAQKRDEKLRNAKAMEAGLDWLKEMAKHSGFHEILFASRVLELIAFSESRLGFQKSPNELVCGIAAAEVESAQQKV